MALNDRIRECRQKAHLSQEKVAELVGVSRQAVTKWETGQSSPSTENLFRLAEIFGITVDFLVSTDTESISLAEQIHQLYRSEEKRKEEDRRFRQKENFHTAMWIAICYLAIFLAGKLFSLPLGNRTFLGWLTESPPGEPSYLLSWLWHNGLFAYCGILSFLPCVVGKRRFSWTVTAGFLIGLPLGELLGPNPAGVYYGNTHYGWAIWAGIMIVSVIMGIVLQRLSKIDIALRSRNFLIWCGIYLFCVTTVILFVKLNMCS